MAFDTEIQALAGSATQSEMDQWMTDGAKEIINVLPNELKMKCITFTLLNADNGTTLDLDGIGKVTHVTRENADSGYYAPCREIPMMYGDLANDSSNMMYYATATDPVFWIESNSSDASTLFVKPTPTNLQPAKAYHITYPSIDASEVSTIANFPDEAEYLVVLYAAIKVLQNKMNEMIENTNIATALGLLKGAVDQARTACDKFENADTESIFGDEDTFLTASSQLTEVKDALDNVKAMYDTDQADDDGASAESLLYWLNDEDPEMISATIAAMGAEIQRAQANLTQWNSIGDMRVKEINASLAEANGYNQEIQTRMAKDDQDYKWYQHQQTKLQQDYQQGLQMIMGVAQQPKEAK
tara:strand:+ start:432 stop:1502 length:1071 start_codon:yes stop_codon:yes gene_type:complete